MTAYVGMPVIYVPRPGRRETEMAALVTAVHSDDRCDLIIFPSMAESIQQPKVPMLSEKFNNHVWKVPAPPATTLNPVGDDELGRLATIVERAGNTIFGDFVEGTPGLKDQVAQLMDRIAALEAKRGPGRPPNPAKSEQAA